YPATGEARPIASGREVSGRRRDGTTFPLHLAVGEMHRDGVRRFTAVLHDLTKRAHLDAQLRASDARWKAVVESAVDAIVVIDVHGTVESFNPAAVRLFGYDEVQVVGRNVEMLMPSPYRQEHDGYLSRYLATGRPKVIGLGREVTGRRQDGTLFPLHLSVGEANVGGQRKFTGILHDLSERVRLEGVMREQESLARLGEMAAVIAHEVKNPLAAIRGAVQIIGSRLPDGNSDSRVISEVVLRIDALDRLMKELLFFARPPKVQAAPTNLADLIAGTASLLQRDPGMREVEVQISGGSCAVPADGPLLSLAFQNLLVNAGHAMQGKGRIDVALTRTDGMCHITVQDQGPGIPPDILNQVFTPFFTTKARGSGLGLATAKRLIEAHQGRITVNSPLGGGTSFHIQLPL
ncbi:MAG: PAS domain S-box protein, partial [Acidobacteriota bacterium]